MEHRDKLPASDVQQMAIDGKLPIQRRWNWLIRLFTWYARRYVSKHFRAVRLSKGGIDPTELQGPLVISLSHPSWWDPMMGVILAPLFKGRLHLVPMDAAALQSYKFFERLGFFGIEPGTSRAYEQLISVADEAFQLQESAIWITPQGRFMDPRMRPLALRQGIGHVVQRMTNGSVLPVALEYSFWNERLPEALVKFGQPLQITDGKLHSPAEWTEIIAEAMTLTQDQLALQSMQRDPSEFITLIAGRRGVGKIYDLWRSLRSRLKGERFDPDHSSLLHKKK